MRKGERSGSSKFWVASYDRSAEVRDGYNVVAWGLCSNPNVIAVTYIWYSGDKMMETDTRMNTLFKWSLSDEVDEMNVQNIMTHEFGHWCSLADLYDDVDYWLTMYGYSSYGETDTWIRRHPRTASKIQPITSLFLKPEKFLFAMNVKY